MTTRTALLRSTLALLALAAPLFAGDWTNNGGNAARNGLSDEVGPLAPDVLWNTGRPSIIAWEPMVVGRRVFLVRQTGFPPGGEPMGSPVVCMDLDTGAECWAVDIPFAPGDWTTWILGASNGLLYVSRSGNGGTVQQVVHALDQANGATTWTSVDTIDPGPYDGVVFAPNGDPIVGGTGDVKRIRAVDGTTAWTAPRVCNVTSSCGVAVFGDGVYLAEPAPGGNKLRKLDLATGASLYESTVMTGFTLQNTPFAGPDGTVYLSRTQNNPLTDFFYAFEDTGAALVEKWNVPAGWSTTSEFGCAPDGSVFMLDPELKLRRLDPDTGATIAATSAPIWTGSGSPSPHFAVDVSGKVFVSNGGFANGELFAYDPDLTLRWSLGVTNVNQGGPALGEDGTLVVAGIGTNVLALRSSCQIAASTTVRDAPPNPASLTGTLPILGSTWTATVDLTTTGHALAALLVYGGPLDVPLAGGQRVLCDVTTPLLLSLAQPGPTATFTAPIPNDPTLCGRAVCAQAAHVGGVTPFALSNALDLVLGG